MIIIQITFGLKFLLCLTGKCFKKMLKEKKIRYFGFLNVIETFLWDGWYKGVSITRMGTGRNCNALIHYDMIKCWSHACNLDFFDWTTSLSILFLYEVIPQCRLYVLPSLATGYTWNSWHSWRLSMFISHQIGSVISAIELEVLQRNFRCIIQKFMPFIQAPNLSYINRHKTGNTVKNGIL